MAKKIAILGGGVAGCAAAYWLSHPSQDGQYEVTLYQMGWRLGGKGASGRNQDPALFDRSEEHGLHVWFGFYQNAFQILRDAYDNTLPNGDFAKLDNAFIAQNQGIVAQEDPTPVTGWEFPVYDFESYTSKEPGDDTSIPDISQYLGRAIQWLIDNSTRVLALTQSDALDKLIKELRAVLKALAARTMDNDAFLIIVQRAAGIIHSLRDVVNGLTPTLNAAPSSCLDLDMLGRIIDLGSTCMLGAVADNVLFPPAGFDKLDHIEFRQWLKKHGARYFTLKSGPIKGLYDLPFAYQDGKTGEHNANVAAGVALRAASRIFFGYKGSFVYKMKAGMGEAVFTPIYELLKARNVKFEFFHKVQNLGLSADKKALANFTVARQAIPLGGDYAPLVDVDLDSGTKLRVWPDRPIRDRLEAGTILPQPGEPDFESAWCPIPPVDRKTIEVGPGKPFEAVILAIPVGGHHLVATELIQASQKWADMVANVKTTRTRNMQLWMRPDEKGLGWTACGADETALVDGYIDDFNTWMDETVILETETYPAGSRPKYLAYFCGPMPDDPNQAPYTDSGYPETQRGQVERDAREWTDEAIKYMWPNVVDANGKFDRNEVYNAYFRANIEPTDRYVLSIADTTKYRLASDGSGFDHLYLAGDWTLNGMNVGCVEAASMSGAQASRSISGIPDRVSGEIDFSY